MPIKPRTSGFQRSIAHKAAHVPLDGSGCLRGLKVLK